MSMYHAYVKELFPQFTVTAVDPDGNCFFTACGAQLG